MSQYFQGREYNDDRLYVLYLCKGSVKKQVQPDGTTMLCTTVYHENPPEDFIWCLVTYRNDPRYLATRVDRFHTQIDAVQYMQSVEPLMPLISLGGKSPQQPLSYKEYLSWKEANGFKEYDYKSMYKPGGTNPCEHILQPLD